MKIAFVNTYPPRKCGIASFSFNLIQSFQDHHQSLNTIIVSIDHQDNQSNDSLTEYYIRQEILTDYLKVAKQLNYHGTDLCIIQHEYGIFGGENGLFILPFIHQLTCPVMVTLHTVLEEPSFPQKSILQKIGLHAQKLIVMNKVASDLLQKNYQINEDKISIVEHGVPNKEPISKIRAKEITGLKQKYVLLSFGLLNRNKGIETVINALPEIVKIYPDLVYVILGITHPDILKNSGDEYRNYLSILIKEKGLSEYVQFHNKFVTENQILQYISAADIFISPYLNKNQITSGTLSYAYGMGALILSTPFIHAKCLLEDDNGILFDFKNSMQLSTKIIQLLSSPEIAEKFKANAYRDSRAYTWDAIGIRYYNLAKECVDTHSKKKSYSKQENFIDESLLPALNLAHLKRLTDDTGIIQHAKYGVPNLKEGYCLDDNSRALITVLMAYYQTKDSMCLELIPIYLSYIHYMQKPSGAFRNFLSFSRAFLDEEGSEDAFGRTIWSLGYLVNKAPKDAFLEIGKEIYDCATPVFSQLKSIRGIANTLIGLSYYLRKFPLNENSFGHLNNMTNKLIQCYNQTRIGNWNWFENILTYDNGILPLALFHSCEITQDKKVKQVAIDTTDFLIEHTFQNNYLNPVGNDKWFIKDSEQSYYDQQAIDAMAMVLLFFQAYKVTGNMDYLDKFNISYLWFLGENSLRIPLYDYETHGCCDGLKKNGVNRNQGAESTLAYLISHLSVLESFNLQY